ncbi:MAG: hydrogenase maturation protease [Deltaproteobacteria bacterium]|nr:hydrogenase maturation protease [Deltaproteobacteria bacterium]
MTCFEVPTRIAVIGIGNVLLGDDGVGPYVVELLRAGWELPHDVTLIDVGTPGLDLASHLLGREVVILVDAVGATGEPGEVRVYHGEELQRLPVLPRVSPHDPAVQEALWIAELADSAPQVVLVGIIPESTEPGVELSAVVREGAIKACSVVIDELTRRGVAVRPRIDSPEPDAWWQRSAARC